MIRRCVIAIAASLMVLGTSVVARAAEAEPSFARDVMAVLSKSGCNAGLCHGNLYGKGGFKLSLRGEYAPLDLAAITRDQAARRVDLLSPEQSLLLLKATASIPHEGGKRFDTTGPEYKILRDWIAAGAPSDISKSAALTSITVTPTEKVLVEPTLEVKLTVTAQFADGTQRDVTRMAVYDPADQLVEVTVDGKVKARRLGETTVVVRYLDQQRPVRLAFISDRANFTWSNPPEANGIDRAVFAKLKSLRIQPSGLSTDQVFVRRVYLDLTGQLPTPAEARAFVADADPQKRSKLIDRLLNRPEFADFWALKWADLLRNEERTLDAKGVAAFYGWIRRSIADGKPMDRFTRELLTAQGSTYDNPPANYYRALRDPTARSEATAQVFLGTRLQCARCHNHPFERWSMDDYYGFAAMFSRVDYKIIENKKLDKNDKNMFIGEQIVMLNPKGEIKDPRTDRAAPPRLLGGVTPSQSDGDLLKSAANWIASAENPLFAQVMANRIWYHLMGRGIVDPIDDFRITNPPSNPQLLKVITAELVRSGFDLRQLVRFIANSRVYQLSADVDDTNVNDAVNFSHANVRRLTAEQLLDAMNSSMGTTLSFNGYPEGTRAMQIRGVRTPGKGRDASSADLFLRKFGKPPRLINSECERGGDTALAQVFELTSGEAIHNILSDRSNRINQMLKATADPQAIIDELYWSTLARGPSDTELAVHLKDIAAASDRRTALEDIAWALLNAKEFVLRH